MSDQPRIRARLEYEGAELIHNDLISAAFYLKERIKKGIDTNNRDGIGLDMMACLTMIAFAFEAYLNFVGFHKIPDFKERQNGRDKRNAIMAALGIEWNSDARPYSTVEELFRVRDVMAHGKPRYFKSEWEAVGTHSELDELLQTYRRGLEAKIDYDLVSMAYDDVQAVWRSMLEAGQFEIFDTMGGGSSGMTFIAFAETDKTEAAEGFGQQS